MKRFLQKSVNYLWLHLWKYRAMERKHSKKLDAMQGHSPVRVVFMAIDVSLWHYQGIYDLMLKDDRFEPTIVLTPCLERDQRRDIEGLRQHFDRLGISYVDYDFDATTPFDIRKSLNPDIIFYTQPYEHLLADEYDCRHFYDLLLCYIPYAFWTGDGKLSYDLHFHNMAWRLYYSTEMHLDDARAKACNKGRNVRVTGYPNADDFMRPSHDEMVWKAMADGQRRKRIIWAPHHTIWSHSVFPARSNFLWMADLMVKIAHEYADRLQIAFKPHPALRPQLYKHPDWGRQRADEYYELWDKMDNTQLETGGFIDLFMGSDAMIHDCGSFTVEYHYTKNPVLYMTQDVTPIYRELCDFGKKAHDMQYSGATEADIRHFIDDIVLGGDDPMRLEREQFYDKYLLPPNGKTVAQNVVDDIVEALWQKH